MKKTTYSERLIEAMKVAELDRKDISVALGISVQAVGKVINSESSAFSAANNSTAAKILGVSPDWLSTGNGHMAEDEQSLHSLQNQNFKNKDSIDIPVFDVEFSMGSGAEASGYEDIVSAITVTPEWINTNLPNITSAKNLRIGSGRGDSMIGTYSHGDMLFIDCGVDGVPFDGVYAFMLNEQLYIKRLQKRPDGSYNMISDNKQYEVFVISHTDKLQIFGRVVWAWNGKRL